MYTNNEITETIKMSHGYSELRVQIGVHQNSALSLLLFTIILQATTEKFKTRCPLKVLYTDDFLLIAESLTDLEIIFLELAGFKVNLAKIKVLVSKKSHMTLPTSGKWPYSIGRKGVGKFHSQHSV